jgi:hypothetical protein
VTEHPSVDDLADLAAGISDNPAVAEHAAGCPDCTAELSTLAQVSAELSALPPVAIPADVAQRIDAALAGERPATTPTTVIPLASRRRARLPGWAAAAAVAVIAVGGSALLVNAGVFDGLGGSNSSSTAADRGAATSAPPGPVLLSSGIDYTATSLPTQLAGLLSGQPTEFSAGAGTGAKDSAGTPTPGPYEQNEQPVKAPAPSTEASRTALAQAAGKLRILGDQVKLANCLTRALGTDLGLPLAVDRASFNGSPAVIAAYVADSHPDKVDVYVLDPSCPEDSFLYFARLARPTPQ